jgi:predicted Zn-dependent peptidase
VAEIAAATEAAVVVAAVAADAVAADADPIPSVVTVGPGFGRDRRRFPEVPVALQRTDLPSGLTVVTEPIPGARSASFGCWVRVGARDEPPSSPGASHFLEHLLFKGTEERSGREISEAIEAVGGELNAHTAHEHTAFYARVPAAAAQVGLDLLCDVVTEPAFDADDVESERQVILEELHLAEDEGDDRVLSLAHEALWGDHPLGREVLGTLASIDAMDRDAIAGSSPSTTTRPTWCW